jgi:molybdate transport system ATP-binding protein
MDPFFLALEQVQVNLGGQTVLQDINFFIRPAEQWAITGPSGSGKTVLAHTLAGRHFFSGKISAAFGNPETFHRLVTVVEQQHRFKDITNRSDFYYQQRYNSFDTEQTITVREELATYQTGNNTITAGFTLDGLLRLLNIEHLLPERLIQLSNGENKRLQLMKALLQQQELLILDQPFTGLDVKGRKLLHDVLNTLSAKGFKFLLIGSAHEIPDCITHIALLKEGRLEAALPKQDFLLSYASSFLQPVAAKQWQQPEQPDGPDFELAVKMIDVNILYEDRHILQHINWEVKKGEKWCLSGPNGAGKSTLLSLITGDNPQAYANEIYLFDRRRGSGESIWDIKQKIGYVSPELHLYFDPSATVFHAIASGLFDTIGLFRKLNVAQEEQVLQWIELLHLQDKMDKMLSRLSVGEQRLVLLARALIKNPPLLVLDEPCQGLDDEQTSHFRNIIDGVCATGHTTLIYVSHYQQELPACIDHYLQIENGAVVQSL